MFTQTFTFELEQAVLAGLATIGNFDGSQPCLTCASSGGKILIHRPNEGNSVSQLNINKTVTAIAASDISPKEERDMLVIGTDSTLSVFDVENNCDIFYKEIPDGVSSLAVGSISGDPGDQLVFIGGNGSIQGFDHLGNEKYWTVTGDKVTCMALCDVDGDGVNELIVGSEDFAIRIFKGEQIVHEVTETSVPRTLCPLGNGTGKFAYGLENGTVGVYEKFKRVWRMKSKHVCNSLTCFDLGAEEGIAVACAWNQGRIEVRKVRDGQLVFKETMNSTTASVLASDYRKDNRMELLSVSDAGEVRAFHVITDEERQAQVAQKDLEEQAERLKELKHSLSYELSNFDENIRQVTSGERRSELPPLNRVVNVSRTANWAENAIIFRVTVDAPDVELLVHAVVIYAEGLYGDGRESTVYYPPEPMSVVSVPVHPSVEQETDATVQVFVGSRGANKLFVHEHVVYMSEFSCYTILSYNDKTPLPAEVVMPKSSVKFTINERVNRLALWVQQLFETTMDGSVEELHLVLLNIRTKDVLIVEMVGSTVQIRTDSMDVAGQVVQSIAGFMGLQSIAITAEFPSEMEKLKKLLQEVDEYNSIRLQLTAEVADATHEIKGLLVQAEDVRLLQAMSPMKKLYTQLHTTNQQLIAEHMKKARNQEALLLALREVNSYIQRAAKLRVGADKGKVVAQCRQALKGNDLQSLLRIIQTGAE